MTLEKLKALLESGAITQEEFDELSKNVNDPNPAADPDPAADPEPKNEPIDYDKLDRIVQARVDKALAEERKKNAQLKQQLEKERKSNLTNEELKKIEDEEREKQLAEREKALADKENRLYAIKVIQDEGLNDSADSLALVDFVMGEDETEIDGKVKAFKELFTKAVNKAVDAEVKKRFKEGGYTPKKGDGLSGEVNPFKAETLNVTEQIRLKINDPEKAARLMAAAGVK